MILVARTSLTARSYQGFAPSCPKVPQLGQLENGRRRGTRGGAVRRTPAVEALPISFAVEMSFDSVHVLSWMIRSAASASLLCMSGGRRSG